jgi:hypothetical protein
MSKKAARNFRRCRAIVVAKDGTRHPTRWLRLKDLAELGPDEMPTWNVVLKQAQRLAERDGIKVKQIDGQYTQPAEETTP